MWTVNTADDLRALPRPGRDCRDQRQAGLHAGAAGRLGFGHGQEEPHPVRPRRRRRGRPPPALPLRLGQALQGLPRRGRRRGPDLVARPFEGMPSECDVIALRELVPAATAPLTLKDGGPHGPSSPPSARRGAGDGPRLRRHLARPAGRSTSYGNPARDLGAVLELALATDRSPASWACLSAPGEGPRLQDLVSDDRARHHRARAASTTGSTTSPTATRAWRPPSSRPTPASCRPSRLTRSRRRTGPDAGTKEHLRWVMPHPEEQLLDALARLHAAGQDSVAEGSRFVGMFRAHGLLAPGLGPAARHRRRGPRGAGGPLRRRPRGGPGRRRADRGRALGPRRPGQPPGHHPLSTGPRG